MPAGDDDPVIRRTTVATGCQEGRFTDLAIRREAPGQTTCNRAHIKKVEDLCHCLGFHICRLGTGENNEDIMGQNTMIIGILKWRAGRLQQEARLLIIKVEGHYLMQETSPILSDQEAIGGIIIQHMHPETG